MPEFSWKLKIQRTRNVKRDRRAICAAPNGLVIMSVAEFHGPGLTEAQWQQVKALATSLDARQLVWVSGFLAGIEHGVRDRAAPVDPASAVPPGSTASAESARRTLTVLHGSETGNSAALAKLLAEQAAAR